MRVAVLILGAFVAEIAACGELPVESAGSPPAGVAAGQSGTSGTGSAGVGAAGTTSAVAMVRPPVVEIEPVPCGATYCAAPQNIAGDLLRSVLGLPRTVPDAVACCVDADRGICGKASSAEAACDSPAILNPQCPGIDVSALAALVGGFGKNTPSNSTGCCTRDACGIDGLLFGRGCIENDEMRSLLSTLPIAGPLIAVPPATSCQAETAGAPAEPPVGSDVDAGLE